MNQVDFCLLWTQQFWALLVVPTVYVCRSSVQLMRMWIGSALLAYLMLTSRKPSRYIRHP